MAHVVLQCPDCKSRDERTGWKTYNGRGKCRCGSYLIHHFSGSVTINPERNTWDMRDEDNPVLLEPAPMGYIREMRKNRNG
jgi:hypothetical protein